MKIHLVKKETIKAFVNNNAQSRTGFAIFYAALKYASWDIPEDICETFGSADLPGRGSSRIVFDIGGNRYRMICKYHFGHRSAFVCVLDRHSCGIRDTLRPG
jgi:mRNA interferase HigB